MPPLPSAVTRGESGRGGDVLSCIMVVACSQVLLVTEREELRLVADRQVELEASLTKVRGGGAGRHTEAPGQADRAATDRGAGHVCLLWW